MVLTLWFSSKAQTVTETEVNLGRQDGLADAEDLFGHFEPHVLLDCYLAAQSQS